MKTTRYKDLEKRAKEELKEDAMEMGLETLKIRLREIESAEKVLSEMKKQYKALLKEAI